MNRPSAPPGPLMMASSSPASRPSPPGGLRPALTPAPGDTLQRPTGGPNREKWNPQKSGLHGFRGLPGSPM